MNKSPEPAVSHSALQEGPRGELPFPESVLHLSSLPPSHPVGGAVSLLRASAREPLSNPCLHSASKQARSFQNLTGCWDISANECQQIKGKKSVYLRKVTGIHGDPIMC